jgi:hypothetical protein
MKTLVLVLFFIGDVSANAHSGSHLDTTGPATLSLILIMVAVLLITISSTPYLKKSPIEYKEKASEPLENNTDSAG